MRFTPAALALSLAFAVTSSVTYSQQPGHVVDPKSAALVQAGEQAQKSGDLEGAQGLYESALAVDPANTNAYIALGQVAQAQNLPGKAIRFYREALETQPNDRLALARQGEAMVQRGAVEKARLNLARLEALCKTGCSELQQLNQAIDKGPPQMVLSAEAVTPKPVVSESTDTP